jgi:hypothetical protein
MTDAEFAKFRADGKEILRRPPQPARKRRVKPLLLQGYLEENLPLIFDPLAYAPAWVRTAGDGRDKIEPRTAASAQKAARTKSIIDGLLMGATFAQIADEMQVDKAVVSRDVAELPHELARALKLISALNRANRELLSTLPQVPHRREAEKTDAYG